MKSTQNSPEITTCRRKIFRGGDCIKILVIVHNQLFAPILSKMTKQALYASKLIDKRENFTNINQVCFPLKVATNRCLCKNMNAAFEKCCIFFACIYDKYHYKCSDQVL